MCTLQGLGSWQKHASKSMSQYVDLSKCGFSGSVSAGTVSAKVAITGTTSHWTLGGVNSLYPEKTGFRVYIDAKSFNPWNLRTNWRLDVLAVGKMKKPKLTQKGATGVITSAGAVVGMCSGGGKAKWDVYSNDQTQLIDIRKCGFTKTPTIFTSMTGTSSHWTATGMTSIYSPNKNNFRVYIDDSSNSKAANAKKYKWSIDYLAVGPMSKPAPKASGVRDESGAELKTCTGHSSKKWVKYGSAEMYQDIDIGHCGFSKTPRVFTSMTGTSSHWQTQGITSIYSLTKTKFRVYINFYGSSSQATGFAKSHKWELDWIAVGSVSTTCKDGVASFKCSCNSRFTGPTCAKKK